MSILAQITRRRVITLTPVAVVDEPVEVDEVDGLFALAAAVGVLTVRPTAQAAA